MATGNEFFDNLPDENKEYLKILFEDKSDWYIEDKNGNKNWNQSKEKINDFDDKLKNFIISQSGLSQYNLSFLHFPPFDIKNYNFEKDREIIFCNSIFYGEIDFHSGFTKYIQETNFENAIFREKVDFSQYTFGCKISFKKTTFNKYVNFKLSNFTKYINFRSTTFKKGANFDEAIFENKVSFWGAIFHDKVHFDSTVFKETFNFTKTQINKITLVNTNVENANLLEISAYDETNPKDPKPLTKDNFANKESARLIKAHFEKQNNITEANKYFVIEQEKYIEELRDKKNKHDGEKLTKLIPLYLNKWISNFGTDWVRAILFFMLWGIVAKSIFSALSGMWFWNLKLIIYFVLLFFIYWLTFKNTKASLVLASLLFLSIFLNLIGILNFFIETKTINEITIITNPISAFKDDETFKGYEAFGALVRVISATIIYQIIIAFRQFTRRG